MIAPIAEPYCKRQAIDIQSEKEPIAGLRGFCPADDGVYTFADLRRLL
jgi:hypothetical protein